LSPLPFPPRAPAFFGTLALFFVVFSLPFRVWPFFVDLATPFACSAASVLTYFPFFPFVFLSLGSRQPGDVGYDPPPVSFHQLGLQVLSPELGSRPSAFFFFLVMFRGDGPFPRGSFKCFFSPIERPTCVFSRVLLIFSSGLPACFSEIERTRG